MRKAKIHPQPHFLKRLSQRGFTMNQVEKTIREPARKSARYAGHRGGTVFEFRKSFGNKELVVAAEVVKNDAYLLTAYFQE